MTTSRLFSTDIVESQLLIQRNQKMLQKACQAYSKSEDVDRRSRSPSTPCSLSERLDGGQRRRSPGPRRQS
jgi:hypothetical protein